ncbi:hypothetical protein V2J09_010840 [Rumex salicifolius]
MQDDDDFATPFPLSVSFHQLPKTKTIRRCKISPPPKRSKSSQSSKENVPPLICKDESTSAFHQTLSSQPPDIQTDPSPPYDYPIQSSQLYSLSDEQLVLSDTPSSPPVNQFEPFEQSEENVSLLDCKDEANLAFHLTTDGQAFDIPTDSKKPYSFSIESLLLSSSREQQVVTDEVADEAEGDFESNSQLDLLISLCSDANENGEPRVPMVVECPVCSLDISDLNEEARQLHTNACLDKCDSPKISSRDDRTPESHPEADSAFSVESSRPVSEWLRSLGLEKCEEDFIREEIDWATLKCMTEEDLITVGVTALGPRKKIVQALNELREGGVQSISMEKELDNPTVGKTKKVAAGRLITDYFLGPGGVKKKSAIQSEGQQGTVRDQSRPNQRRIMNKCHVTSRKPRDVPLWCTIPGTPFRVDAFRYLRRDCAYWFLTHFHADHYGGLTRSFSHGKIYCSMITARLVHMKIGIPWDALEVLPLNQRITINGIHVTCFDANHCPGAVVILFEPPNGKAVLHTGDFRFSEEMAWLTAERMCPIHTLILDTTYCNPKYDFPKQEAIVQFVIEAIQAESFHQKTLFLIGSYTIGKERVFLEVARVLRKKVYVTAAKLRILKCLELPKEDMQWLTSNEYESHIHVVPLWLLASFKRLKQLSLQYTGRYSLIVAFSPTGWSFGKGMKSSGRRSQQGTIIRYEVPYSEHSSFTELKQFVKLISPENIIPSVNNHEEESSKAMVTQLIS